MPSDDTWWARNRGPLVLGQAIPIAVAAVALLALAEAVSILLDSNTADGLGPCVLMLLVATGAVWLAWRLRRTVWLVLLTDSGELACVSTARQWLIQPGDILAVRGDAYGIFLVFVTKEARIWLWAGLQDKYALLRTICQQNPSVDTDRQMRR